LDTSDKIEGIKVTTARPGRINIWHNILWSKYKGEVFSSLYAINDKSEYEIRFFQIAETEGNRTELTGVDLSYHRYPYTLLFQGSYDNAGLISRIAATIHHTRASEADLTILAGFEKYEYWLQLFFLRMRGKKVAVFCDSTINDRKQSAFRGILKRLFFRSVHGFFCYGERSREYVVSYGGDPRYVFKRCQAAALPFDYSAEKALEARIEMAAPAAAPRYLYVGRLSPEKGLDTLLAAFANVFVKNEKATLVLVGSGQQREALQARAGELGLEGAVTFAGSKGVASLAEEYLKASCLMLPSTSEPWGLVVNEALAYGCPVITSNICGCVNELVIEGKSGFTHRVGDADDLAEKMMLTPAHFADTADTARNCIELISGFSPTHAATQILAGIRAILAANSTLARC
jgi:glycosyltransferase involved in cell wall biosynthesis